MTLSRPIRAGFTAKGRGSVVQPRRILCPLSTNTTKGREHAPHMIAPLNAPTENGVRRGEVLPHQMNVIVRE
jgi:hypothetical protein